MTGMWTACTAWPIAWRGILIWPWTSLRTRSSGPSTAWRHIAEMPRFRPGSPPSATSVALNGLRKLKRFRERETDLEHGDKVASRRSAEPDLKERLAREIDRLPLGYRTVFVMHDVEGYTHEEIGTALGVETGTSKAQLSRARAKLREALADFAGEWKP